MTEQPEGHRLSALLLLSLLSMVYAEVYSGSSPLWFLDPFAYIVTVPLYGSHTILFLNLAIRYRRTSLPQLYLWGVFFALYESWVTKVLWAGYPGSAVPMFGTIAGIAWGEFLTLVFLWHPIFSFVIPVVVYQLLCVDSGSSESVTLFWGHHSILTSSRRTLMLWGIAALFGGLFLPLSLIIDASNVLVASVFNVMILLGVYALSRRGNRPLSIDLVTLGRRGTFAVGAYVIAQYVVFFPLLLPERIPGLLPIVSIVIVYIANGLLLYRTPQSGGSETVSRSHLMNLGHFARWSAAFVLVSLAASLVPDLGFVIGFVLLLSTIGGGLVLFGLLTWKALKTRNHDSAENLA